MPMKMFYKEKIILSIYGEYVEGILQEIESIEHRDGHVIVRLCNGETRTISSEDPIYTNLLEKDPIYTNLVRNRKFLLEEVGNGPYKAIWLHIKRMKHGEI